MKKITPPGRHRPKKQDAVSPVVGVMLMLVVTIIIAAVVSSFASGLGTTSEAAPTTSLQVSLYGGTLEKKAVIEHLGGEALPTRDLQIITSYTVPDRYLGQVLGAGGKTIMHTIDGKLAPTVENDLDWTITDYPFVHQVTNNDKNVTTKTVNRLFGDATLTSGSSLVFDIDYFLGFNTTTERKTYGFSTGTSEAHVSIIHTPSGKVIFDKDVRTIV
ncbi:type IV pilin N-terminal domain-containing protein [Methanocorpusculum sp. MG]|uniref:Type IV pilin N-terminal domain-containing protein n=1 Tax=Methanocorpusculum petauri TaxID=3002863 RepID=A0ABT4IDM1_9EURY|nr:type IV pilin N-terminal domain-containing protein [Methanocorpusculum petauri]MCZ0859841.1 type IV pilin N-terminal domain-containing protein [Methanocorpusculum petauri]